MRKSATLFAAVALTVTSFAAFTAIPAQAQSAAVIEAGRPLFSADGKRLGAIYRINDNGSVQVVIDGRMVTVPGGTVSVSGERIVTSLTRRQVIAR